MFCLYLSVSREGSGTYEEGFMADKPPTDVKFAKVSRYFLS